MKHYYDEEGAEGCTEEEKLPVCGPEELYARPTGVNGRRRSANSDARPGGEGNARAGSSHTGGALWIALGGWEALVLPQFALISVAGGE